MKQNYEDIRSRITEPPRWYDEAGVPRYVDFSPGRVNNIYAEEVALIEIACQNCDQRFIVAISQDSYSLIMRPQKLSQGEEITYGDPPNIGCCPTGPTMSSNTIKTLEIWRRGEGFDWGRVR